MSKVWENPHKAFLEGVVGVVKATHTERHMLWEVPL